MVEIMSQVIQSGRIVDTIVLIIISALSLFFIWRARKGYTFNLQRLPAVEAIEEAIGRAVEMGRPVHYTTGMGEMKEAAVDTPRRFPLPGPSPIAFQRRVHIHV